MGDHILHHNGKHVGEIFLNSEDLDAAKEEVRASEIVTDLGVEILKVVIVPGVLVNVLSQ